MNKPTIQWQEAKRVADFDSVEECLTNFSHDSTEDNAICVVRAVLESAPTPPAALAGEEVKQEFAPEPTPLQIGPDTVMAKPVPINDLWNAIGAYCEAVIDDELGVCGIGEMPDARLRIGSAKRLMELIGDRTDHDSEVMPASRLHKDATQPAAIRSAGLDELQKKLDQESNYHLETIKDRDYAEEIGTELANEVGKFFRVDVGEHSSANDPRKVALAVLAGEYVTDSDKDRQVKALDMEVAKLTKLAKDNNADAEMYARAWERELLEFDGKIRNKRHHIDAMILSTRDMVELAKKGTTTAPEVRREALEEAARLVETTRETTTIVAGEETRRHLTPRKQPDHDLTGRAWAAGIRALMQSAPAPKLDGGDA